MSRFARAFPGFTLHVTRRFWVFLAVTPLLSLASLNTGNNALYLLLALLLGSFVASGAFSRHSLRHLRAVVRPPKELFAGAPASLEIELSNGSRWLPAAGIVCRLGGMPGYTLAPTVSPRGRASALLVTVFWRRGRHRLPPLEVEVRLPLGFFVKSLRLPQELEVLVYPRRFPGAAARLAGPGNAEATTPTGPPRRGGEIELLRDFHPGDDRRDIHWKQTARQQRLIVMERRERSQPARFLVLDRQLPRRDQEILLDRFEDLVSEVASAALERLRRGEPVGLILGGTVTLPGNGRRHLRRVLEQLALVQAVGPGEDPLPASVSGGSVYRLVAAT